ncbi:hypothetical protein KKF34_15395 [Myxococcota bacterium]|nr:hypothetical protein [Myxococcota bacterium]MBU1383089.1 hypothetical protein [Myxococcota bacterium]MBU1498262.1 hypothetical protein [Myxococcota bacterium]
MRYLIISVLFSAFIYGCTFDSSGKKETSSESCSDGIKNGNETDLDCGGTDCNPCGLGFDCITGDDCTSGFCNENNLCSIPEGCNDGELGGSETDVDCGGGECSPCGLGKHCETGNDCVSGFCDENSLCAVAASCTDGEKNINETDIDCGGQECNPCVDGLDCLVNSDCVSQFCNGEGICATISCEDNELNGNETDIDCGGDTCNPCENGETCIDNTDCISDFCDLTGVCTDAPTCTDNQENGSETDVDCGGPDCSRCSPGQGCLTGSDCTSGVCGSNNICAQPACNDNVLNGNETDVDCGGNTCGPCEGGEHCIVGTDCESLICDTDNRCTYSDCFDGIKNGTETDIDCGGLCAGCSTGENCNNHDDCGTGVCNVTCQILPSCKAIFALNSGMQDGYYQIQTVSMDPEVYCTVVSGTAWTLKYISAGTSTNKTSDNNSCKDNGLIIFTPTTQAHYNIGRDFALALGADTTDDFMGPLGIYNTSDGDDFGQDQWCGSWSTGTDKCCHRRIAGGGGNDTISGGDCGFTSLAGTNFWASDLTTIGEPSGDYDATCWLGFSWDTSGNVTHLNDENCNYSYSSYLCMATDDAP